MRSYFVYFTPFQRVGVLLLSLLLGVLLLSLCAPVALQICSLGGASVSTTYKVSQFMSAFFVMILPSLFIAYLFGDRVRDYLRLQSIPNLKSLGLATLSFIFFLPFLEVLVQWNQEIQFPEYLQGVGVWMRRQEQEIGQMMLLMLTNGDGWVWLTNWLIAALLAALSEEFFFRGVLQRILLSTGRPPWMILVFVAFIFSAIHFQFYGFFPRFFIGLFLGVIFYVEGNLWTAVWIHLINNTLALIEVYLQYHGQLFLTTDYHEFGLLQWGGIFLSTLTASILFYFYLSSIKN